MASFENLTDADLRSVTFITGDNTLVVRPTDGSINGICNYAKALKATHFVMVCERNVAMDLPVWGVIAMRTADPRGGGPGQWTIRDPIKTFTTEKPDAAVMWALHHRSAT